MNRLLETFFAGTIKKGCLDIVDSSGALDRFGDGSGVPVRVQFNSAAAERGVLLDPEMNLGEAYMDGGYDIEVGTVLDFLTLLRVNVGGRGRTWWMTALAACRSIIRRLGENNNVGRARVLPGAPRISRSQPNASDLNKFVNRLRAQNHGL